MNKNNANEAIEKFLLRINKEVMSLAKKEAQKDDRSLNSHIITLIKNDLTSKGIEIPVSA
jgi:predicted HicB family RNase H-like nuclease